MFVNVSALQGKENVPSLQQNDYGSRSYPSRTIIHPKLELTEPGDNDEQEADAAANDVMSGKVCRKILGGGAGGGMAISSQMESQLNHLQGGGQTMPAGLRSMMEHGFKRDFSQVRLHTDSEAVGLSSSIHAKAFTHGNDIYFNRGQFSPETSEGRRLVAHELTHVAQGGKKVGRDTDTKPKPKSLYGTSSDKLSNAKALAKKMIERSIKVLELLENQGEECRYSTLFDYCFCKDAERNKKITKSRKLRIEIVKKNYDKMLNALDKDQYENISIQFKLVFGTHDWQDRIEKYQFENGVDTNAIEGFTTNYYDITNENIGEIYINYTNSSSLRSIYDDYNWNYQLKLASLIIHELSHRICGTEDFSYMGKNDTRESINYHDIHKRSISKSKDEIAKVIDGRKSNIGDLNGDILTNNASSYEVFSAWVESTVYSVYDQDVNSASEIDNFDHEYSTQGGSESVEKWKIDNKHFNDHGIPNF